MNKKTKNLRFWFSSGATIDKIATDLQKEGVIEDFEYDYENTYEWVEATTSYPSIDLNISRKRRDGGDVSAEPITVLIVYLPPQPPDELVDRFAGMFARHLQIPISLGTVEYLGGDDFAFSEQ